MIPILQIRKTKALKGTHSLPRMQQAMEQGLECPSFLMLESVLTTTRMLPLEVPGVAWQGKRGHLWPMSRQSSHPGWRWLQPECQPQLPEGFPDYPHPSPPLPSTPPHAFPVFWSDTLTLQVPENTPRSRRCYTQAPGI